jgi:hypothetical protein
MCIHDKKLPQMESSKNGEDRQKQVNYGVLLGSLSVFMSFVGASATFPFLQAQRDALSCDALCYGTMQASGRRLVFTFYSSTALFFTRLQCIFLVPSIVA